MLLPISSERWTMYWLSYLRAHLHNYIDDVIIFSRSFDDHLCDLNNVLLALCSKGFTIKPSKCVWAARSVEYLGFEVGEGNLSVPEARVQSISSITLHQTIKQLRSFLGTVGYYRRFIPQFANFSSTPTPATVMGMPKQLSWSPSMLDSFDQLRVALSNVLCLCIPSCSDVFTLVTDASSRKIGSVLCVSRDLCDFTRCLPLQAAVCQGEQLLCLGAGGIGCYRGHPPLRDLLIRSSVHSGHRS